MTQYNSLNVKLSNSQLKKLKPGTKNVTELTLNIPSRLIGDYSLEINISHNLLVIDRQVPRSQKSFCE